MRAYQLLAEGGGGYREVPKPDPGPGQVLIKVAGVGLCHTDEAFLQAPAGALPFQPPFTLGHETTGWVEKYGADAPPDGPPVGTPVIVYATQPCGTCRVCAAGAENSCPNAFFGRGYGNDGGLAPYLLVDDPGHLIELGDLDPIAAAPLCDAGTTSYHAVRRALPKLKPGGAAVVIGTGGLGGYAVQWLRILSDARIIAVDTAQHRLDYAKSVGADELLLSTESVNEDLKALVGNDGADIVLDFVGVDATLATAAQVVGRLGSLGIVGAGGGTLPVGWGRLPFECEAWVSQGSTVQDLRDVVKYAQDGKLVMDVERFSFDDIENAYQALHTGSVKSRAVVEVSS